MSVTYTWVIEKLATYENLHGYPNVVVNVFWKCTGIDDQGVSMHQGGVSILHPPGSPYIPYENLTEEIILNWIWDLEVDKNLVEELISNNINSSKKPKLYVNQPPWVQ